MEFHPEEFVNNLPVLGKGMLSIFIVIGVIALVTYGLNWAFSREKKDKGQ